MTENEKNMRWATINFLKKRLEELKEELKYCSDFGVKQSLKNTYLLNKRFISELESEKAETIRSPKIQGKF